MISLVCRLYAATAAAAKSLQSCLTLCDPIEGSPRGSLPPIPGILQAGILEWVGISFSNTGEGNGTQLQYSYLENPMDGGAW